MNLWKTRNKSQEPDLFLGHFQVTKNAIKIKFFYRHFPENYTRYVNGPMTKVHQSYILQSRHLYTRWGQSVKQTELHWKSNDEAVQWSRMSARPCLLCRQRKLCRLSPVPHTVPRLHMAPKCTRNDNDSDVYFTITTSNSQIGKYRTVVD